MTHFNFLILYPQILFHLQLPHFILLILLLLIRPDFKLLILLPLILPHFNLMITPSIMPQFKQLIMLPLMLQHFNLVILLAADTVSCQPIDAANSWYRHLLILCSANIANGWYSHILIFSSPCCGQLHSSSTIKHSNLPMQCPNNQCLGTGPEP